MDSILELARRYNLIVIEDACQAHGAEYFSHQDNRWSKAGSMGRAAAFSFYPGKNLGACGEAGAVTTNDKELALKIRKLRDHGQAKKYYHDVEGYNGRLDAIQAGLLSVKLKHLASWNQRRAEIAQRYDELLATMAKDIVTPHKIEGARPVYHLYVIRVRNRKALQDHLSKAGIDSGIHYPIPLHLQKAYAGLGYKQGDFPVTEQIASEILSLPMYPQLTSDLQDRIAGEILDFLAQNKASSKGAPVPRVVVA
jgi:dTDP-4-amino-4,6-dideoxygalactose transaminase